jgi:hypothetical protein
MDAAYVDKLDGKIPEDFWQRKNDRVENGRAAAETWCTLASKPFRTFVELR